MKGYWKLVVFSLPPLFLTIGCDQGYEMVSLRPTLAHATPATTSSAAGQGRGPTKRALVDVDRQKLRHVIKPGETLEWKGIRGTSDFYIHFAAGNSPCPGNDFPGSATTPASCVVDAMVPAGTEFPYEIVKRSAGIQPAAYYYQVKSCNGCYYSTE
jgi:hypothetical protein